MPNPPSTTSIAAQTLAEDAERVRAAVDLSAMRGARVLITGASGLVGTHLLGSALADATADLRVTAVLHGEPPPHLAPMLADARVRVLRGDLADPAFYPQLPAADLILHAAGYGQPGRFLQNPLATLRLNTAATFALLDRLAPGGRLLFVSTSELYSGNPHTPHTEEMIGSTGPLHPRAAYIEGKRCGEATCIAARASGVQAVAGRLALAYGPGTRPHDARVLNAFIERGLTEGDIRLMDPGRALRTYCYVTDAVTMLWRILLSGEHPVYNVGGRSTVTIAQLAQEIGGQLGVPVSIPGSGQEVSGAPDVVQLSTARYEAEFGTPAWVGLAEGVRRTITWQRSLYGGE